MFCIFGMKPITLSEIKPLMTPVQHFSDCYMISSIGALARSEDGRKILSKNIAHRKDGFRIRFQNLDERRQDFFVTKDEMDHLVSLDKYYNEVVQKYEQNPIIKAIEVAMNKLLEKYPWKKPLVSRLMRCQERFEYNKPSNFLEMFTGKTPFILNEGGVRMTLKNKIPETQDLFERLKNEQDYSFIAGTGMRGKNGLVSYHCYTVLGVDSDNFVKLYESRKKESITLNFRQAIDSLKFFVGYFKDMM